MSDQPNPTSTSLWTRFDQIDRRITHWMARNGIRLLRISLGIVYLWFGVLKFFPGLSPAEDLAARTIETMSFGLITPAVSLPILAVWESLIGLGLLLGIFLRATLFLLFLQMVGAVAPLFLFPGEAFTVIPIAPTLEGQYIIKNMVIISAALVIGATVRGGDVVDDPEVVRQAEARSPEDS
ncbi:MAG TPA: DoxX family membrane protein [Anaerolineales bacterium]|nr:DoxX family membrane protein [Anaerolineales bacterium]